MAKSTDLAVERVALLDSSKKKNDGREDLAILPWQLVTYHRTANGNAISGVEPIDAFPDGNTTGTSTGARATEKQITEYQAMTHDQMFHLAGTGGDGHIPVA